MGILDVLQRAAVFTSITITIGGLGYMGASYYRMRARRIDWEEKNPNWRELVAQQQKDLMNKNKKPGNPATTTIITSTSGAATLNQNTPASDTVTVQTSVSALPNWATSVKTPTATAATATTAPTASTPQTA